MLEGDMYKINHPRKNFYGHYAVTQLLVHLPDKQVWSELIDQAKEIIDIMAEPDRDITVLGFARNSIGIASLLFFINALYMENYYGNDNEGDPDTKFAKAKDAILSKEYQDL